MFSPRIGLKPLENFCRRLGISLEAGIDLRTVLAREAERAQGAMRGRLREVSEAIDQGESLAAAFRATGDYFPTLFREMVAVGEEAGHLDGVLRQLAEHYEHQLRLRRSFWGSIAWPLAQLGIAVVIVGFVIWVTGFLRSMNGPASPDILGFGLMGASGLAVYVAFVAAVSAGTFLFVRSVHRGLAWVRPLQRLLLRLPGFGKPLETLALARLAWSMHVTMNAGMDLRRALALSLRAARNARYMDHIPVIDAEILAGSSIHEAFRHAGGYPTHFLDTLAVGEESGRIVESMGILARQYQEQARAAMASMTVLAGWAVWLCVAAIIIAMIFRIFSFYLGAIGRM